MYDKSLNQIAEFALERTILINTNKLTDHRQQLFIKYYRIPNCVKDTNTMMN